MGMGPEIKAARKAKGMTQADFAKALGLNRATISKYESGVVEPSFKQIKRMADVLGVQWYLLVPPENKEVYAYTDTYGLTRAEYERMKRGGAMRGQAYTEVLRDRYTGKMMDITIHVDGSMEESPHYIPPKDRISMAFRQLNKKGMEKAADMVEMIAGNPEYQYLTSPDPEDEDDYYEGEEEIDDKSQKPPVELPPDGD